jgi:hypothetical protein
MYFASDDLIQTLAKERQQRLIQEATNRRLIRESNEARPSARGWRRLFQHAAGTPAAARLFRLRRTSAIEGFPA